MVDLKTQFGGFLSLLIKHTRLIGRNHVFDIDEGILAAVSLEHFERFVNQIANVLSFLLTVIDAVSQVTLDKSRL